MPNPPPSTLIAEPNGDLLRALAIALFSGLNPDGSAFTVATSGGGGGGAVDVTDRVARLLGHETNLDGRYGTITGYTGTVSASGDTTIRTPAAGKTITLKWVGMSSPDNNPNSTVVTVKLGGNAVFTWDFSKNGGAMAHGTVRNDGGVNGALVINLSVAATVRYNFEVSEA